jgi:hypothetical protein
VSEREQAAKTISAASSMKQLQGAVETLTRAMGAQLGGLKRQYEEGTLRKDFERLLSPAAQKRLKEHEAGSTGGTTTPAPGRGITSTNVPFEIIR